MVGINNILNNILPSDIVNIVLDYNLKKKINYIVKFRDCVREMHCLFFYLDFGNYQYLCDYFFEVSKLDFLLKVLKVETGRNLENVKEADDMLLEIADGIYDFKLKRLINLCVKINIRTREFDEFVVDISNENIDYLLSGYLENPPIVGLNDIVFRLKQGERMFLKKDYRINRIDNYFGRVVEEDLPQKKDSIDWMLWKEAQCKYRKRHPSIKNKTIRFRPPERIEFFNFKTKSYDDEAYKKAIQDRL